MNKLFLFFLVACFAFTSCKKTIQTPDEDFVKTEMSIAVKHKKASTLSKLAASKIENWQEYTNLNEFLIQFENISPDEALNLANELSSLTKSLKDSIKNVPDLKNNAVTARINVLENETLRLKDMTKIPAIRHNEINTQIDKILLIFGSFNEKVNTLYTKKQFDEEIDLDQFFDIQQPLSDPDKKRIEQQKAKLNKAKKRPIPSTLPKPDKSRE